MLKLAPLGFDINDPPEGVWGTFAPPDAKVKVRKVTAEVIREIRKKHSTTQMQPDRTGRMVSAEVVDPEAFDDALTDYVIEEFSQAFGDENGQPLPVNLEGKKRLLNNIPLKEWIWAFAQSLDTTEAELGN